MSESLVVIGNGMAAARFADELAKRALGRYAVAIIGDEPRLAYNRVMLSSVLAGEATATEIELRPASWWRECGVTLCYGSAATQVDLDGRTVTLASGRRLAFSKLVFATGSVPLRLNVPGADLPGVMTFRDSRDVERMLAIAGDRRRVVVVGGGLLGLEAAYGLVKAGARVTLVHLMDRLMERQLDAPAAQLLRRLVEARGVEIILGASTSCVRGASVVEGVEFADGRCIHADAVVFAAGIRPNIALAQSAGLTCGRGIVVDDGLATSAPDVFALGECADHRGICYGLVEPAYEQARVLADRLAGGRSLYQGSVVATNLKVSVVSVFSAGEFQCEDRSRVLAYSDPAKGVYKKLVLADGCLDGAVLVGDTRDALWYLDLIRTRRPIGGMRNALMFGRALADAEAA